MIVTSEQLAVADGERERRLLDLGIVEIASRPTRAGEQGPVRLLPRPNLSPPDLSWGQVTAWVGGKLASPGLASHLKKLADTGAPERHLVLGVTASAAREIFWALTRLPGVPEEAPCLPPSVTHLWLFDAPHPQRVLVWFPDRGWLDARENWATA